jgi:hypothetical protein
MNLSELVSVSASVITTPAASASFAKPCLIGNFSEVPVDKRHRTVTPSSYASIMDTTQAAIDFCTTLWYQDLNVSEAEMIRWVSAAIAPRFVMTDFGSTMATWQAVTVSGDFAITDGSSTEQFATGSFAAATDMDDVATIIQTEIRTSSSFAADLSAAVVGFDALGRMYLETADTGESATTYTIIAPTAGAGTDITTTNFLNIASRAFVVSGMDAEDPDDALADCIANFTDDFYTVHETGASVSQQQALASAARIYGKIAMLDLSAAGVKDSSSTTDVAYLLYNASVDAYGAYSEHSGAAGLPVVAANGAILPNDPGSKSLANKQIKGVNISGLGADGTSSIPLTATERAALDDKNCDYVVRPVNGGPITLRNGLLFSGLEFKTRWGLDWWEYISAIEIAAYLYGNDVTFSDTDITAIVGILTKNLDILIARKCLESYTVTIPKAADISAVVKATHTLTLSEVASAIASYAVNDVVATIKVAA